MGAVAKDCPRGGEVGALAEACPCDEGRTSAGDRRCQPRASGRGSRGGWRKAAPFT